jgi:C4-dicarboxylate-specific signal transduction histidine kinase
MSNSQPDYLSTRNYGTYALITLVMVGAMLAWHAWKSTGKFREYHQQLALTSVTGAADELEFQLSELHRSMRLFADDQRALLEEVASDPDNDAVWAALENKVQSHFPEYYGLTLTNRNGDVMRPDFDNEVDELCQRDIHTFIDDGYSQQGYIHPNPMGYHFDVMVPWGDADNPRGVFFLSFPPDILARTLQRIQPPGHALLLLRADEVDLIEVTGEGTRTDLQRDFTLSSNELARILYARAIPNSRWELVDLPEEKLFRREALRNANYAIVVFCAFAAVGLLMLQQLRRKELRRLQAEEQALQHQADLAHVDRISIMGEMASGLAHELNQPLSAISTYCQAGLRIIDTLADKPDKLVHALEHASIQAQRAGEIIRRMRRFTGKGVVRRKPIDINRVIINAVSYVETAQKRKGIKLVLDLADGLPAAIADEIQIEQVILNLLHNAIEAMFSGSENTRILRVSSERTALDTLQVTVNDSGPGLDAATLDSIFDTFFTTKKSGTGLGLAISRSIVEAHGGQLWADSTPGAGATFYFTLSVAAA